MLRFRSKKGPYGKLQRLLRETGPMDNYRGRHEKRALWKIVESITKNGPYEKLQSPLRTARDSSQSLDQ